MLGVWVHGCGPGRGIRMARGWHYTKLSLSSALLLHYSGMCILFYSFLFVVLFCFAVFFFCSRTLELCRCSSNLFLSSRPRTYRIGNHLLYVLEARSVNNVKKQQQMYTYINRHARTPNKTKIRDTMSLDYSSVCNIGSRVVWVSMKKIH